MAQLKEAGALPGPMPDDTPSDVIEFVTLNSIAHNL
jgi:hypothetical protein